MANWTCPYCQHAQTHTRGSTDYVAGTLDTDSSVYGRTYVYNSVKICANEDCRQITLTTALRKHATSAGVSTGGELIKFFSLLPASFAKPQPSFIPDTLVSDYKEACEIRDLSPKASATLSRR
ncbi:MAG TPA: hypothetical protein VIF12_02915, partial [Micavibrio sp.]